jgi:LCP family protein required for cell wall assembly
MEPLSADAPQPFKPRHTNAQRAILGLNIVVVLACLIGAGAIIYGKQQLDQRLQTGAIELDTTVPGPANTAAGNAATSSTGVPETFPPADPQAKNFLIVGSDANACVDADSPWSGAADPLRENIGNRSDTIMVMRVDPSTRTAAVLSFPRDLWLPIPGKSKGRINSAYIKNDPSLLSQTLYENFGVTVDHYVQVDFCAFKRIVEAVGGVAVPFSTPIIDKNVNINIPNAGCHTFRGDEALAYVRSRHLKWIDSNGTAHEDTGYDLARISRQQDFLRRTLRAALDKGVFDPAVARALITSLQTDIVTEQGFTINDMLEFAGVLKDVDPAGISTYQIEASRLIVSGNDVLEPKVKGENMKSILAIFRGEAPLAGAPEQTFESTTTSSTTSTTLTPAPGATTTATTVPPSTEPATTTSTLPVAAENPKGDIVPDPNITCG